VLTEGPAVLDPDPDRWTPTVDAGVLADADAAAIGAATLAFTDAGALADALMLAPGPLADGAGPRAVTDTPTLADADALPAMGTEAAVDGTDEPALAEVAIPADGVEVPAATEAEALPDADAVPPGVRTDAPTDGVVTLPAVVADASTEGVVPPGVEADTPTDGAAPLGAAEGATPVAGALMLPAPPATFGTDAGTLGGETAGAITDGTAGVVTPSATATPASGSTPTSAAAHATVHRVACQLPLHSLTAPRERVRFRHFHPVRHRPGGAERINIRLPNCTGTRANNGLKSVPIVHPPHFRPI
jgi:hypothetical protein